MHRWLLAALSLSIFSLGLALCSSCGKPPPALEIRLEKPAVYLYPVKTTDVTVKLEIQGKLTGTYPEFDPSMGGWNLTAFPDGTLLNKPEQRLYSYLYWEAVTAPFTEDLSTGFVVSGDGIRPFFRKALTALGLNNHEINDFIVYWYPIMKDNPYNLVHFAGGEYAQMAKLRIVPAPDTLLRVFMLYRVIDHPAAVSAQTFASFERKGFTAVEWGGARLP